MDVVRLSLSGDWPPDPGPITVTYDDGTKVILREGKDEEALPAPNTDTPSGSSRTAHQTSSRTEPECPGSRS